MEETVLDKTAPGFKKVITREFHRMTTRPLYLLITIVLPLISFSIFWIIFISGVPKDLPICVYDADNTQTSRRITRMLDATSLLKIVRKVSSIDEGKKLMLKGKINALVVFPKNMEKDIIRGQSPQIVNFYNNEFLLVGSLINRDVTTVISTVSKGFNLSMRQRKSEMATAAMAHIEPVAIKKHTLFNPYLNYFYYLTGTLQPTMLQIFIVVMTVFVYGIELKEGSAGDLFEKSGKNLAAIITGKLLPYTLVYTLLGLFMNIYLFRVPGFPFRGSVSVIVIATLLFVLANQAIGVLMITVTANLRLALSVSGVYSATAFAFSGVAFPVMGMPVFAKIWSSFLPLTYYIKIFIDQSMKGAPVSVSIPDLCFLSFFIIGGVSLSCFRIRTLLKDPIYWGRA